MSEGEGVLVSCECGQVYDVYGYDFEGHGNDHAIYPEGEEVEPLSSADYCECGRSLQAVLFEHADRF